MSAAAAPASAWTCPFCALLCDEFALETGGARPVLQGSECPRAREALVAHADTDPTAALARIDGAEATLAQALGAAAQRLAGWRQPLFAGLGTDVAGARALYRLAERTGAICDTAGSSGLMHGLRALQDRGQYTATLAEVRTRAEVVVCVGTPANVRHPEFFRRIGIGTAGSPCRALVFLDTAVPTGLPAAPAVQFVTGNGELFDDLQQLAALVARQQVREPAAALQALAETLLQSRYSVLVWEPGALPPHGALLAECLQRIVATLNRGTRAATLALGGDDGAATVNQVHTWLSGLPVRTRNGPLGLEHDPWRFDAARLMEDDAVDGLLWLSSFDPARIPPDACGRLPRIVIAPPAAWSRLRGVLPPADEVFLPVATPGLTAPGHLFRTDGIVVVPLEPVRADGLPGASELLARLAAGLGTA